MKRNTRLCLANTVCAVCKKEEGCREDCDEIICLGAVVEKVADKKQDIQITLALSKDEIENLILAIHEYNGERHPSDRISQFTRNKLKKALE